MCVLSELTLTQLKAVSTATLTTALFKRGFRNTFLQGPQRLSDGENMAGPCLHFTIHSIS